jgi:hypothetical protein
MPVWAKTLILIVVVIVAWSLQFAFALIRWGYITYQAIQEGGDPEQIIRLALTRPTYEDTL